MFITALFAVARTWKLPKCLSTEDWIKKLWYTHTVEYHSAIKRNDSRSFVEMRMDLESVMHSEVSKKNKREKDH